MVRSRSIRRKPAVSASQAPRQPGAMRTGSIWPSVSRSRAICSAQPETMKPSAVTERTWITGRNRCSTAATIGPSRRAMR